MPTYLGISSTLYKSKKLNDCINLIENAFKNDMNRLPVINPQLLNIDVPTKYKTPAQIENYKMKNLYLPALAKCSTFVYYLHDNVVTHELSREITESILSFKDPKNAKSIYRIFDNTENNNNLLLYNMNDQEFIKRTVRKMSDVGHNKKWALPTVQHYIQWFDNNPETKDLIKSQFAKIEHKGNIYRQAMITHESSAHATNDFRQVIMQIPCSETHNWLKHCFINPTMQEKLATCPFTGTSRQLPRYNGIQLEAPDLMTDDQFIYYLMSSRTVHASTFIYDEPAFQQGKGIYERDSKGVIKRNKNKKKIVDKSLVKGMVPVLDLDVMANIKKSVNDPFFNKDIFGQYNKTIEITKSFLQENDFYEDVDYKIGLSGKGIYFILEPLIFDEIDSDFITFKGDWAADIVSLQNKLNKNGIDKIHVENLFGWSRYFKTTGTFHLSEDNTSLPWNNNEPLDYDYLSEVMKITSGLDKNIIKDILLRSKWRT